MDPVTIGIIGVAALLLLGEKEGAYGEGSKTVRLERGKRYRVTFDISPVASTNDLFAVPQATLGGWGMAAQPESVTFVAPNWRMTALAQYSGNPKDVDTLPGMTIEPDPAALPAPAAAEEWTTIVLESGTRYRITFPVAPVADVASLFAMAATTLGQWGSSGQPESVVFGSPEWRLTARGLYSGERRSITLDPRFAVEPL
jgi:hypothetical protein